MTRPNRPEFAGCCALAVATLFALVALSPFPLRAQTKHTPTIDESLSLTPRPPREGQLRKRPQHLSVQPGGN